MTDPAIENWKGFDARVSKAISALDDALLVIGGSKFSSDLEKIRDDLGDLCAEIEIEKDEGR